MVIRVMDETVILGPLIVKEDNQEGWIESDGCFLVYFAFIYPGASDRAAALYRRDRTVGTRE